LGDRGGKEGKKSAKGLTRFPELESKKGGKDECERFEPLFGTRKQKEGKNGYQRFDPP
jgi:hypothetical protein